MSQFSNKSNCAVRTVESEEAEEYSFTREPLIEKWIVKWEI